MHNTFHKIVVFFFLMFTIVLFPSLDIYSEIDKLQWRLSEQYEPHLRWYNIERKPQWVSGVRPDYDRKLRMHTIRLSQGEVTMVRIPAHGTLRIYDPLKPLVKEDLKILVSNGTGLYTSITGICSINGKSILVTPSSRIPMLVRIKYEGKSPVDLALFQLHKERMQEIAPYRSIVRLRERSVRVRRKHDSGAKTFWIINANKPLSIDIDSREHLVIQSRLKYPPTESRRIQRYRINVRLNGRNYKTMEFDVKPESVYPVFVNSILSCVGELQNGYVTLPESVNHLELEADNDLYLRILKLEDPDYLFPHLNRPFVDATEVMTEHGSKTTGSSFWNTSEQELLEVDRNQDVSTDESERISLYLARDNSHREGGMIASALMKKVAAENEDFLEFRSSSEKIYGLYTFYRNLLPYNKVSNDPQRFKWFLPVRLREPGEPVDRHNMIQHLADIISDLPGAYFTSIYGSGNYDLQENTQIHYLPKEYTGGYLRVIVDKEMSSRDGEIILQFDNRKTVRISLDNRQRTSGLEYISHLAGYGLDILRKKYNLTGTVTDSSVFSLYKTAAKLAEVGYIDIPIPDMTEKIKVYVSGTSEQTVGYALQYRTSKQYSPSESEYLGLLKDIDSPYRLLINLLHYTSGERVTSRIFDKALESVGREDIKDTASVQDTSPLRGDELVKLDFVNCLIPVMRSLRSLKNDYVDMVSKPPCRGKDVIQSEGELDKLSARAVKAETDENWLSALEIWSRIIDGAEGDKSYKAQIERVKVLQRLGEFYLAKNQLLGMYLYGESVSLRWEAFDLLYKLYEGVSDNRGLLSLLSTRLLHEPDSHTLTALVNSLVEDGRYKDAIMLGLTIRDRKEIVHAMIRAAYQTEWWQVFEEMLDNLNDEEEHNYWMGQKVLKHGEKCEALEYFRLGGEEGRAWIDFLEEAEALDSEIESGDKGRVNNGLVQWAHIQKKYPGKRVFKENHTIVADYAGGAMLYSTPLDRYSHAYISNKEKPVNLEIMGPATIKIEARPLHDNASSSLSNDWLKIEDSGRLSVFPISNNVPSQNITVVGNSKMIPGNRVAVEYRIGSGLHRIIVSGERNPLLISVSERRPEIETRFLPSLTQIAISQKSGELYTGVEEKISEDQPFDSLIVRGDIQGFSVPIKEDSPLQKIIDLLWIVEHETDKHEKVLHESYEIFTEFMSMPGIKSVLNRINKKSTYKQIRSIQNSAGIYYKETSGWQPESQFLRVRKTLLPPVDTDEEVIYGHNKLNISMVNTDEKELVIELRTPELGYIRPVDMEVTMQLDDTEVRYIQVPAALKKVSFGINVPEGKHHIQLGIADPVLNQYLLIKISERGAGGADEPNKIFRKKPLERQYFVSTRDTPVRLHLKGPGLLRINELVDDSISEEFMNIKEGWQDLEIRPEKGEEERWLRFFRMVSESNKPVVKPRRLFQEKEIVDRHRLNIGPLSMPQYADIEDSLRLGGQEDGTWTLRSSFTGRRNQQEDKENNQAREEFLEFGVLHKYYNEPGDTLTDVGVFGRKRHKGEPTIGFEGNIVKNIKSPRLTLQLNAKSFFQRPESVHSSDLEWIGFLRGEASRRFDLNPKMYHRPTVSLFMRALSLNSFGDYDSKDVDQDIFTPYKREHRYGMSISDTATYRPWLDTVFFAKVRLNLNEDFNFLRPDNYHLRAGWKQLVGNFQINATYNYREYLVDRNREESKLRHNIKLGVLWNRWSRNQSRMECGVEMIRQLESGINSGMGFVQWHIGNGRGLRDFRKGIIDFFDVRRFRIPRQRNNSFKYK